MVHRLENARLADGRLVDLVIDDLGLIERIEPRGQGRSDHESTFDSERRDQGASGLDPVDDLGAMLVLPAMAEPHAHLDKALTADDVPNPTGDLRGAIDGWIAAAATGRFTHEDIVERASRAIELLVVHGVTAVRTHVNVLGGIGASSVVAIKEAAARHADRIEVQTVALTSSPMTGAGGAANRAALVAAVEAGVDLVGGCPHHEDDPAGMIANAIAIADDAGIGLDLHVDETLDPAMLTLREYARQVIDRGFSHLAAASHCVSLGMQPLDVQKAVASEVAEAGLAVFPLPSTNLFLQGRGHAEATPRGLTAVQSLIDAGVLVAAGGDNVQDPFNLVGRSDPLETAALMIISGHRLPSDAYDMVSTDVRRALGLPSAGIVVGEPADLVVIDAPSIRAAIAQAPMTRRTYRRGKLVASTNQQSTLH